MPPNRTNAEKREAVKESKHRSYRKSVETPEGRQKMNERKARERRARVAALAAKAQAQTATTSADPSPLRATPGPSADRHDIDNPPVIASEDLECATPPTRDFLEKIHGHYIDGRAPTIGWANDSIVTVLPFLDDGSGGNLLEDDVKVVTRLSKAPMITFASKSQFPFTHFFTKDDVSAATFMKDIREVLANGKVAILPKFQPDVAMSFSVEDIQHHLGLASELGLTVHDLRKRVTSPTYPQLDTTLGKFMADAKDTSIIQMGLNLFLPHVASPPSLRNLDDGMSVGWAQAALSREPERIVTSAFASQSWGLLHHPGTFTPAHQDSQGCITLIEARSGSKFWGFLKLNESALGASKSVTQAVQMLSNIDEWADTSVLQIDVGDIVIMPPGTFHTVYTPTPSIFTGRFLYTYDTMHLTEVSQRLNMKAGNFVTNQDWTLHLNTFCLLALGLPQQTHRVFYRRSLIALCLIIVLHKDYIPGIRKRDKDGTYKVVYPPLPNCRGEALKVCTRVLEMLGFSAGATVRTGTLAEKLARLAKLEYDILSRTQHYTYPGVTVDISFLRDL